MISYNQFRELEIEKPEQKLDPDDFSNVLTEAQIDLPGALKRADDLIDMSGKVLSRAEKGMSVFDRFKNLFMGIVGSGGGANRTLDRLQGAADKAKAQYEVVREMARRVEGGMIKLKTEDDVLKFRDLAAMSGVYSVDGEGQIRNQKGIAKHIDIVIAKNYVSQVSDRNAAVFLSGFMDRVDSNDFCSL